MEILEFLGRLVLTLSEDGVMEMEAPPNFFNFAVAVDKDVV